MKDVGASDFYEVRLMSLVGDIDISTLTDLYLPLIGPSGFAAYLSLTRDPSCEDDGAISTHERLFNRLQLAPGNFFKAMEALEAVGLIKTYVKASTTSKYFIYCLYAPLDPNAFLNNVLLFGTLKKYLSESEIKVLQSRYAGKEMPTGCDDVSQSFTRYFNPDYSDPIYKKGVVSAKGHVPGKIDTAFDVRKFEQAIQNAYLKMGDYSKEELDYIEKLSSLYNLDSSLIGELVASTSNVNRPYGQRVDLSSLEKRCRDALSYPYLKKKSASGKSAVSGDSPIAQKIKQMDGLAPATYLSFLQGGHKPAVSDLKILQHLALDMGLPNPCVNVVVDYVLATNNNVLSYPLCEKIAASLVRAGIDNARDAMEYLKDLKRQSKKRTSRQDQEIEATPQKEIGPKEEPIDQAQVEADIDFLNNL